MDVTSGLCRLVRPAPHMLADLCCFCPSTGELALG